MGSAARDSPQPIRCEPEKRDCCERATAQERDSLGGVTLFPGERRIEIYISMLYPLFGALDCGSRETWALKPCPWTSRCMKAAGGRHCNGIVQCVLVPAGIKHRICIRLGTRPLDSTSTCAPSANKGFSRASPGCFGSLSKRSIKTVLDAACVGDLRMSDS